MCTVVLAGALGVSNLFSYCYYGKIAMESFSKMPDCFYECNWQELPVNLQKYFILMIENMQKPIYYHGFGVFVFDLENFSSVKF